jgi:hypothetical protein
VFEGRPAYELRGTLEVQPQRLRDPREAEFLQLPRTLQRTDVIDGDEMCRRARTLGGSGEAGYRPPLSKSDPRASIRSRKASTRRHISSGDARSWSRCRVA